MKTGAELSKMASDGGVSDTPEYNVLIHVFFPYTEFFMKLHFSYFS